MFQTDFIGTAEAAAILAARFGGYSAATLRQMCNRRAIPGAQKIGRDWMIPVEWVKNYNPKRKDAVEMLSLTNLTQQESGIVVYDNSVLVVNWQTQCPQGLPRVFAGVVIGVPGSDPDAAPSNPIHVDDIRDVLPDPDDMDVVYDHNDDISELYAGNAEVTSGRVWHIGDATVIAPDGWC